MLTEKDKSVCEIRASKETYPKNLALSILSALNQGKEVHLSGVGDALKTMTKAMVILERYNNSGSTIFYKPSSEQVTTSVNTCTVVTFVISMDSPTFTEVESNEDVVIVDCLNNKQLLERSILYYRKKGYELKSTIPITKDGVTSYIYLIFDRNGKVHE